MVVTDDLVGLRRDYARSNLDSEVTTYLRDFMSTYSVFNVDSEQPSG